MHYDDLGHDLDSLAIRWNAKGAEYSQFWTAETPTRYADGSEAPKRDWLGYIRCGVCGRPLERYGEVPGPNSDEWHNSRKYSEDVRKYLGWVWSLAHPSKRHPGRPQEYHPECSLMMRDWDRWKKAQAQVRFDPQYGDAKIKEWQARLQAMRNSEFGSGRFSPKGRKAMFGGKRKDTRPKAERKTRRKPR